MLRAYRCRILVLVLELKGETVRNPVVGTLAARVDNTNGG